jgi:site-specific recombinase XerD
MASVRPEGYLDDYYQIRFYDSHRSPKETADSLPKSEYTWAEAEKEADYRQALYDRGEYDPWAQAEPGAAAKAKGDPPLQELAELYVEEKRRMGRLGQAGGWTEKTYRSDAPILRRFASVVGPGLQASRLRTAHIEEYVYQDHLSNATKRGYHRRVRAMLAWAEKEGLFEEAPSMPPPPKKQERKTETLTESELGEVCSAHRSIQYTTRRHCLMWRFQYYQGLRPGEMYELRIRNVDLTAGEIQIGDPDWRQKSGEEDVIPLLPPGQFYIRPFLAGEAWVDPPSRESSDRVFGAGPGARRPSSSFKRAVRAAGEDEETGITPERAERISMYTLRHSCATHWLREGKSLIWVNRLLRHSQVQTTMEYVHLAGVDLQEMR